MPPRASTAPGANSDPAVPAAGGRGCGTGRRVARDGARGGRAACRGRGGPHRGSGPARGTDTPVDRDHIAEPDHRDAEEKGRRLGNRRQSDGCEAAGPDGATLVGRLRPVQPVGHERLPDRAELVGPGPGALCAARPARPGATARDRAVDPDAGCGPDEDAHVRRVSAGRTAEQRGRGTGRGPHLPAVLAGKAGGTHGEATDHRLGLAAHRHPAAGRVPGAAVQRTRGQRGTWRAAQLTARGRPVHRRPPCHDHLGDRPGAAERRLGDEAALPGERPRGLHRGNDQAGQPSRGGVAERRQGPGR